MADAQSHHCRLSIFRTRVQKEGSKGAGRVPTRLVGVTLA